MAPTSSQLLNMNHQYFHHYYVTQLDDDYPMTTSRVINLPCSAKKKKKTFSINENQMWQFILISSQNGLTNYVNKMIFLDISLILMLWLVPLSTQHVCLELPHFHILKTPWNAIKVCEKFAKWFFICFVLSKKCKSLD